MRRLGRIAAALCAGALLATTAYGPGNVADAIGYHQLPPAPVAGPGFDIGPTPLHLRSLGQARIYNLQTAALNQFLTATDGTVSPPLVYMRMEYAEMDDVRIDQARPGQFTLTLNNYGSGVTAASLGSPGTTLELWAEVKRFDFCVTADAFNALVVGYAGVFGGRLDEVLRLIADTLTPTVNSTMSRFGPCVDVKAVVPILTLLVDNHVPLPSLVYVGQLDALAYAVKVTAPPGVESARLPATVVEVKPWQ
ncbi:hypothetical protein [Antrihabitans stalactiti]|uniref:Uncharacterized protein n=1 Tax=Antrihabitans stalactiti TaxID=2584121 RepID=A0A848KG30_9NOCA|nr:hypothetical protein [Antrihabitans stalactiti]NMN96628.1 hypothetical protein [Antrihabitans stalactiti]